MADGAVQRDLFGETDATLARQAEEGLRRQNFEQRARLDDASQPVIWTAPHDWPGGRRGDRVPGWRCWLCGEVEVNEYVLGSRHGLRVDDPQVLELATCTQMSGARR